MSRRRHPDRDRAEAMLRESGDPAAVAEQLGLPRQQVARWGREAGIPLNGQGRPRLSLTDAIGEAILSQRAIGRTDWAAIGRHYGVSRQRVQAIAASLTDEDVDL